VPGASKRAALAAALGGPVSESCPASVLRTHPDCTLFADLEAYQ
jgi:glucosamine-6-phosphate deaminase